MRPADRALLEAAIDRLKIAEPARLASVLERFHTSLASVRAVVLVLGQMADDHHGDCFPSQLGRGGIRAQLHELGVELGERAIRRAIRAAEVLELVDTLTGPDAWAVYRPIRPNLDQRRNAYRVLPLIRARHLPRRAPAQDTRTAAQRAVSRQVWRHQQRTLERAQARAAALGQPIPQAPSGVDLFGCPWPTKRGGRTRPAVQGTRVAAATPPASPPRDRYLPDPKADTTQGLVNPDSGRGHPFRGRLEAAIERQRAGVVPSAKSPPRPPKPDR